VVEVVRAHVVEGGHRVHAVAVSNGEIVQSAGDPGLVAFFRSSAKPIQALPVVRARPDLDDAEIAIASASHLHRPDQLEPVRSLLAKADATEDDLECGRRADAESSTTAPASKLRCCSSAASAVGRPRDTGLRRIRVRRSSLVEVGGAAEVEPSSIPTGSDGCGVVTFG
jgi:L-asparaginase II